MLNELYTFAEPAQVVPFSNLKWGKFTLLHTLLWRVFSPKTFHLSNPVLRNADGNGNKRPMEK